VKNLKTFEKLFGRSEEEEQKLRSDALDALRDVRAHIARKEGKKMFTIEHLRQAFEAGHRFDDFEFWYEQNKDRLV